MTSSIEHPVDPEAKNLLSKTIKLDGKEEHFRQIVGAVRDFAIFMIDPNGIVKTWNVGAERFKGYKSEEIIGKHFSVFYTVAAIEDEQPALHLKLATESNHFETERWSVRKNGSRFWAEVFITPIHDHAGVLIGFVEITRDITNHNHAAERFRLAIEAAPAGMLMIDQTGTIVLVNAQVEVLFGYDREDLVGKSIEMLVPERFRERHPRHRASFFKDPKFRPMGVGSELYGLRKDGTEVPIEIGLNPLETINGKFVLSSIMDISEHKRSVEQFRLAIEAAPSGMLMIDQAGKIVLVNKQVESLFGYERVELVGKSIEMLVPVRFRERHPEYRGSFYRNPTSRPMGIGRELYGLRKDGSEVPIEIGLNPLKTPAGDFVLSSVVDITERKQAATERDRFFELSADMLFVAGANGNFRRLNPAFCAVLGYETTELVGKPFLGFVHPEDLPTTRAEIQKLSTDDPMIQTVNRYRCKDGAYKWMSWRGTLDVTGTLYGVARDVTQEKLANERVRASLREKVVLLQEVHHRVKNNLQIISSLINMQLQTLEQGIPREAFEECQNRVQAIALIHEKLYQSEDQGQVPFFDYVKSLTSYLLEATGFSRFGIALDLAVEPLLLPVDKAIPCGLILNELIINSLKHAFPGDRRGTIRVELFELNGSTTLIVADDGIGFSDEFDIATSQTLGLRLVCTLADQLDAKINVNGNGGSRFQLTFCVEK